MKLIPNRYDVFDDVFDSMFNDPVFKPTTNGLMKTDIRENENSYTLEVELPGYKKEEVNLDYSEGYLSISASHETNDEEKDAKGNLIRSERSFGSCKRSFYVGEDFNKEDIKANFADGILTISVPKVDETKQVTSHRIMID